MHGAGRDGPGGDRCDSRGAGAEGSSAGMDGGGGSEIDGGELDRAGEGAGEEAGGKAATRKSRKRRRPPGGVGIVVRWRPQKRQQPAALPKCSMRAATRAPM